MPIVWVGEAVVLAIHDEQLAEHGGAPGLRDAGLLKSTLARPQTLQVQEAASDLPSFAAAYGYGLPATIPSLMATSGRRWWLSNSSSR